jgi:hypothetical protein
VVQAALVNLNLPAERMLAKNLFDESPQAKPVHLVNAEHLGSVLFAHQMNTIVDRKIEAECR